MINLKFRNLFIILVVLFLAGCSNTMGSEGSDPHPTDIIYTVHVTGHVHLWVENSYKTKVATLVDEIKTPGNHRATFDAVDAGGNNLSEGIYTYHIKTEWYSQSRSFFLKYP